MTKEARIGWACIVGFLAMIVLANYSITHWGTPTFPGGPHTVTVLWWTAPSGVLFAGATFSFRDGASVYLDKRWPVLAAILVGAGLSYFTTSGAEKVALASGVAFLCSESADWLVFSEIGRRRLSLAILLSNTVGAALDSALFLWLAFGSLGFFWGQFFLKMLVTVPVLAVVVPLRIRRSRKAFA